MHTHTLHNIALSHPLSHSQAVYGVLSSIEGYDSFKDMLNYTSIGPWYFATQKLIQQRKTAAVTDRGSREQN